MFFWLVEHAQLQRYLLSFVPADGRAGARDAWNEIETRLGLWVRGQLTLMASMGVATGIAYTVLGVPGALLLGLIAALTEAIPIVGPLLGAIPAVLVATTVSPELALIVAGVYIVIQLIEGSVLVPLVMRNTVGISPLLVLLSVLVGGGRRRVASGRCWRSRSPPRPRSSWPGSRRGRRRSPRIRAAIETPDEEDARGVRAARCPTPGEGVPRRLTRPARRLSPRAATAMPRVACPRRCGSVPRRQSANRPRTRTRRSGVRSRNVAGSAASMR